MTAAPRREEKWESHPGSGTTCFDTRGYSGFYTSMTLDNCDLFVKQINEGQGLNKNFIDGDANLQAELKEAVHKNIFVWSESHVMNRYAGGAVLMVLCAVMDVLSILIAGLFSFNQGNTNGWKTFCMGAGRTWIQHTQHRPGQFLARDNHQERSKLNPKKGDFMRKEILMNKGWTFVYFDGSQQTLDLPHTWNAKDGQDGGNDYRRGTCVYKKDFAAPAYGANERVYLDFAGVNASAKVTLNDTVVMTHDGGYSTFRADVTDHLKPENHLVVEVDNSVNDRVYPQKADFTFYGGIYRDVKLIVVNQHHFDMDYLGGPGIAVHADVKGSDAYVRVRIWHNVPDGSVIIILKDADGKTVAAGKGTDTDLVIKNVHLWDGIEDPYLYHCEAVLSVDGAVTDTISTHFGARTFRVDPQKGFFLNGRSYPLRGVCRHQDWKGIGNALTTEHHDTDMAIIREIGANTIRLAHYQHDQYFYDLCDKYGMVVWAEIPYISEHLPNGRENTISQMKELIIQNYNHPSIVCWGVSNEITISTKDNKDMLDNHHVLNDLCHEMDPTRFTTLACYAMCGPFNKVAHITDVVSWNLYLGWYVPGMKLNDAWVDFFHAKYPNRCLGYSEYGCECMPNLHSSHPKRGDQSEEYQCLYNEYMLKFFEKRPFMWATHLWNMFDFAADARNQGGEPGMNHKGLVTFDRKTRKDSFYIYKAWWSKEPFVYICGRRYVDRPEKTTTVKVYSNLPEVTLYANGQKVASQKGDKVFTFQIPLNGEVKLEAVAGDCRDEANIRYVSTPNPAYKLHKDDGNGGNWT